MYGGRLPAFRRNEPGAEEKQKRKVQDVKAVGKPGEAMRDSRVGRRILTNFKLEQGEQKKGKGKPDLKIDQKRIPLPNTRESQRPPASRENKHTRTRAAEPERIRTLE